MSVELRRVVARGEGFCGVCEADYECWFAPNELWNAAIRLPSGYDEFPFICPTCFIRIAAAKGLGWRFKVEAAD